MRRARRLMRRGAPAILALGATLAAAPAAAAPPRLERAAAAIVVDARDGDTLFAKDPRERRAIASATKLMTALLALQRARPDDVLTAPAYSALPAESRINLRRGERMRVDDLLEALLLESANDAAVTLARGVSGSREEFVEDMNDRAAELGLDGTRFANPIGLDEGGNHSTARDLATLAVRLMRNGLFARIVDRPSAVLESGARRRVVENRNDLIRRFPFVDGIKTGHTLSAGYVLVGAAGRSGGARVISVVLGEPSEAARDSDTLALLRWGLSRFRRVPVLRTDRAVVRVSVDGRDERAALVPRRAFSLSARRGERIEKRANAPAELDGPLPAGRRVGSVTVLRDGKPVRRVDLLTAGDVPGSRGGVPLTPLVLLGILLAATLAAVRMRVRLRLVRERPERTR